MPLIITTIFFILIGVIFFWSNSEPEEFYFPKNGDAMNIKIRRKENDEDVEINILETEGIRHNISFSELTSGGPGKDGIPSIDKPRFISIKEADSYLSFSDPGIALQVEGITRFYPFQILVWHEIVNDIINGKRVLIAYCPLCFSGMAFDPYVGGERVEFGISGKLWNSNLIMYDRGSQSLWSHLTGESIVGEMTGIKLKRMPSEQMCYGAFRLLYPEGEVLSRDTGFFRFYGDDPYSDYYLANQTFFPVSTEDNRLDKKDFIFGVIVDGKPKAYWIGALQKGGEDFFGDKKIVWKCDNTAGSVRMFEDKNGYLEKIYPIPSFWFAWAAIYPKTEVYK